ncbi:MAG: AAA family ATPase [Candidatus Micrarchaeota archaeon]|nr:AAA family ATPase [Candidatus Micrarchaeota archaeon]
MESSILRNSEVFEDSYLPSDILHREKEIKDLSSELEMFSRSYPLRAVVYGPPGTGKTTVAKYIMQSFSNYHGIKSIYVNSLLSNSKLSILSGVADSLGIMMPRRGIGSDEIISRIKEKEKRLVIIIDEADSLKEKDFLYYIAKSKETIGLEMGFVAITNVPGFLSLTDARLPALITKRMEFKPYSPSEIRDIILERAKKGLMPGTFNEEIIGKIAGFAARHLGNVRLAIYLLLLSAKKADRDGKNAISLEDVDRAKEDLVSSMLSKTITKLSEDEKKVMESIESMSFPTSSDIEKRMEPMASRTVRDHIKTLIGKEYILSDDIMTKEGKKRVFRVNYKF